MDLAQLNSLDLKGLAQAPLSVKAGVVVLILIGLVVAGYFFDWSDKLDQLEKARNEELTLRDTYTSKKRQAIHFDTYKQRLADTEKGLAAMLRQLPNKSEMDALLTDINQTGIGRGLEFELFRPGVEVTAEFYATLPVAIKVKGGYHDLAGFVSDIAKLPRIVTIHDVILAPQTNDALAMDASVRTYRYLDENELVVDKKQEQKK